MYTATLISAPTGRIEPALVESLRNAWGGGVIRALGPDAAEFDMPAGTDTGPDAWAALQERGVDLVVQPAKGRRKHLLLADMDSTMIRQECIDELAAEAGVGDRVAAITARAMNGELDFEAALTERVGLLGGLYATVIDRVLKTRISLMPGGPVLVATMKASGARAALVSGGFTAFTSAIAAQIGFDEHRANTLEIERGRLTGRVIPPILGRQAKVDALDEITARIGITASDVLAVGDGANDLGMLQRAGTGVALHAKPAVQAQARIRINHSDLTALLYIQGYSKSEFAGGHRA